VTKEGQHRTGGSLGFVVGFGIGIPATIFALSNLESVTVEFLGWQAETPLWAVITLSLLAGALLGVAVLLTWQARRRHGRKKQAKKRAREEQRALSEQPSQDAAALEPGAREQSSGNGALTDSSDADAGRGSSTT
jgi:uncharacterized integral membrane protein